MLELMSKKSIAGLIVAVLAVIGGAAYWAYNMNASSPAGSSASVPEAAATGSPGVVAGTSTAGEPFAASIYAPYAYLISTDTFDAATRRALTGFTVVTSTNPDGSLEVTLTARNPNYQTHTYTVETGQKLYYIERT